MLASALKVLCSLYFVRGRIGPAASTMIFTRKSDGPELVDIERFLKPMTSAVELPKNQYGYCGIV